MRCGWAFSVFLVGLAEASELLMKDGQRLVIDKKLLYSNYLQEEVPVKALPILLRTPSSRSAIITSLAFQYPAVGFAANGLVFTAYALFQGLTSNGVNKGMLVFGLSSMGLGTGLWFPSRYYSDIAVERYNHGLNSVSRVGPHYDKDALSFGFAFKF